jgi:hypothetical protein
MLPRFELNSDREFGVPSAQAEGRVPPHPLRSRQSARASGFPFGADFAETPAFLEGQDDDSPGTVSESFQRICAPQRPNNDDTQRDQFIGTLAT